MKKLALRIRKIDHKWVAQTNNRLLLWLLQSFFELDVSTQNIKGLDGVLSELNPVYKHGRVIKAKSAPEYEPGKSNKGGRVVRNIPKQLKKMKEAQSEVPTVQN